MTNYLRIARAVALNSPHPLFRHATLVFKGGKLLARGYNHDNIHSEQVALSKIWPNKRKDVVLLNVRLSKNGENLRNSKPCPNCQKFLEEFKISKVFYTDSDGNLLVERI